MAKKPEARAAGRAFEQVRVTGPEGGKRVGDIFFLALPLTLLLAEVRVEQLEAIVADSDLTVEWIEAERQAA